MKTAVRSAAFLVAISGLMVTAAMSSGGPESPQATGMDLSVSAVASSTSGTPSISINPGGAAPPGFFGLTMGTVSCNVGTLQVFFNAAMQTQHPYIATNVYRLNAEGRLEQLSAAWVKHAFSSASANQTAVAGPNGQPACGTGSCDGVGGNRMGFNCSDTYGSGLNASTFYLGPRSEIIPNSPLGPATPPAGQVYGWNNTNSFFDNFTTSGQNDVLAPTGRGDSARTYTGGVANQPQKFNLIRDDEIARAALVPAGAPASVPGHVFMESYYVVNGDVNKMNNHAWRRFRVTGTRTFAMDGQHTFGPVALTWGDQQQLATPATEGSVYVASRVVPTGGLWRYEYNVYNLDHARGVKSLEIPVPEAATISNPGFFQPRQSTPGIDVGAWSVGYDAAKKAVVFQPPAPGAGLTTNSIRWGTMYTFWYTSNLPPRAAGSAVVAADRVGTVDSLTVRVSVPKSMADVVAIGGFPPADGLVTVDDYTSFLNAFASENLTVADVTDIGGLGGPDGALTVDDYTTFINAFAAE